MPVRLRHPSVVFLAVAVLVLAAVGANYLYRQHLQQQAERAPAVSAAALIGQPRPDFVLPDALGLSHRSAEWDGRVLVLNFWASWCVPCAREIPSFIELQKKYGANGVQFVGIAVDRPDAVEEFLGRNDFTLNYPNLIGDANAIAVAESYGDSVGILPYTVVIDKSGKIAHAQFGELTHDSAEQMLLDLLQGGIRS